MTMCLLTFVKNYHLLWLVLTMYDIHILFHHISETFYQTVIDPLNFYTYGIPGVKMKIHMWGVYTRGSVYIFD